MAIKSYTQQLEEVQAAISSVMLGQSYEIAGRKMVRANLKELTDWEGRLRVLADRETRGGIRLQGVQPLS